VAYSLLFHPLNDPIQETRKYMSQSTEDLEVKMEKGKRSLRIMRLWYFGLGFIGVVLVAMPRRGFGDLTHLYYCMAAYPIAFLAAFFLYRETCPECGQKHFRLEPCICTLLKAEPEKEKWSESDILKEPDPFLKLRRSHEKLGKNDARRQALVPILLGFVILIPVLMWWVNHPSKSIVNMMLLIILPTLVYFASGVTQFISAKPFGVVDTLDEMESAQKSSISFWVIASAIGAAIIAGYICIHFSLIPMRQF
jgi:hypothetical protein